MGSHLLQFSGLRVSPFQQGHGTSDADDFPGACEGTGKFRPGSGAIEDCVSRAQWDGFPLLVGLFQILRVVFQQFLASLSGNGKMLGMNSMGGSSLFLIGIWESVQDTPGHLPNLVSIVCAMGRHPQSSMVPFRCKPG